MANPFRSIVVWMALFAAALSRFEKLPVWITVAALIIAFVAGWVQTAVRDRNGRLVTLSIVFIVLGGLIFAIPNMAGTFGVQIGRLLEAVFGTGASALLYSSVKAGEVTTFVATDLGRGLGMFGGAVIVAVSIAAILLYYRVSTR
jgi:hypothetical protein